MTKDEFLDIMGEIDGKLIESALDISRMETVEIPYERPPVLRYILGAAACVAAVFVTALAVRYFNGIAPLPSNTSESYCSSESANISESSSDIHDSSTDVSDSSTESTEDFVPDFIRGWNPDDIPYDGLCGNFSLGESAAFSTAELDGIRAMLILHDITKLPGEEYSENNHDYTNYYGAKDIALYVTDDKGNKVLEENVTPHFNDDMKFIHKNCFIGEGTRLFRTEMDNEERYILMQIADYNEENDAPIARFYECESEYYRFDENGIAVFGLTKYESWGFGRIGGWCYGYQASDEFYQNGGAAFVDPKYNYKLFLNPNSRVARIVTPDCAVFQNDNFDFYHTTGWDPEALPYNPYPDVGESAVVSRAELDGIQVELIMINVIKRPWESHYTYRATDNWVADDICLYIKDDSGRKVLSSLLTPWTNGVSKCLPESCLFDGCTKIFSLERGDELDYVIMQYCVADKDSRMLDAVFVSGDMELYDSTAEKDENGISMGGGLLPVTPRGVVSSSSDGSLVILEDGSLYDSSNGNIISLW